MSFPKTLSESEPTFGFGIGLHHILNISHLSESHTGKRPSSAPPAVCFRDIIPEDREIRLGQRNWTVPRKAGAKKFETPR